MNFHFHLGWVIFVLVNSVSQLVQANGDSLTVPLHLRRNQYALVGNENHPMGYWNVTNEYDSWIRKYRIEACCIVCPRTGITIQFRHLKSRFAFVSLAHNYGLSHPFSLNCAEQRFFPSFKSQCIGKTHFQFTVGPQSH